MTPARWRSIQNKLENLRMRTLKTWKAKNTRKVKENNSENNLPNVAHAVVYWDTSPSYPSQSHQRCTCGGLLGHQPVRRLTLKNNSEKQLWKTTLKNNSENNSENKVKTRWRQLNKALTWAKVSLAPGSWALSRTLVCKSWDLRTVQRSALCRVLLCKNLLVKFTCRNLQKVLARNCFSQIYKNFKYILVHT